MSDTIHIPWDEQAQGKERVYAEAAKIISTWSQIEELLIDNIKRIYAIPYHRKRGFSWTQSNPANPRPMQNANPDLYQPVIADKVDQRLRQYRRALRLLHQPALPVYDNWRRSAVEIQGVRNGLAHALWSIETRSDPAVLNLKFTRKEEASIGIYFAYLRSEHMQMKIPLRYRDWLRSYLPRTSYSLTDLVEYANMAYECENTLSQIEGSVPLIGSWVEPIP